MTLPTYDVEVELTGHDGNAFMIIGLVRKAMKRAGIPEVEIKALVDEMTSGDYDHLLATAATHLIVL